MKIWTNRLLNKFHRDLSCRGGFLVESPGSYERRAAIGLVEVKG